MLEFQTISSRIMTEATLIRNGSQSEQEAYIGSVLIAEVGYVAALVVAAVEGLFGLIASFLTLPLLFASDDGEAIHKTCYQIFASGTFCTFWALTNIFINLSPWIRVLVADEHSARRIVESMYFSLMSIPHGALIYREQLQKA